MANKGPGKGGVVAGMLGVRWGTRGTLGVCKDTGAVANERRRDGERSTDRGRDTVGTLGVR